MLGYSSRELCGAVDFHNPTDIAAPCGTEIRAASAGVVIPTDTDGWNDGYGNYIRIDHGNL